MRQIKESFHRKYIAPNDQSLKCILTTTIKSDNRCKVNSQSYNIGSAINKNFSIPSRTWSLQSVLDQGITDSIGLQIAQLIMETMHRVANSESMQCFHKSSL